MATLDLVTLAEAKQALDLTMSTSHDTEIALYVTAVSARLDALVGPIVQRAVAETLSGGGNRKDGGRRYVFLSHYPVSAIASVSEFKHDSTTPVVLTETTNLNHPDEGYKTTPYAANVALKAQRLERRKGHQPARFPWGDANIEVTYTAGRVVATADVPEKYKIAAGLMLQNLWRSQQDSTGGVGEFELPQANFPTSAVPSAVRHLLQRELQEPRLLAL